MKIKVISLNVWLGGKLFDGIVEFLKREDPDILLLQEVFDGHDPAYAQRFRTMDEFARLFQFNSSDFAPEMLCVEEGGKVERGDAILSKFPITQRHEPIFFNEPYNNSYVDIPVNYPAVSHNLQHVTISVEGTDLDVFNFQGVWDLDGDNDSPSRLKMSKTIIDAVRGKQNVILGGDTNATPNSQTIKNIEAELTSVFKGDLATSFNVRRKDLVKFPGYATAVVDALYVSPSIKVVDSSCPDVDIADHLPLVVTIEI